MGEFGKSLFGYHRQEVDSYISDLRIRHATKMAREKAILHELNGSIAELTVAIHKKILEIGQYLDKEYELLDCLRRGSDGAEKVLTAARQKAQERENAAREELEKRVMELRRLQHFLVNCRQEIEKNVEKVNRIINNPDLN